jgi:phage baseplate assembly protein W
MPAPARPTASIVNINHETREVTVNVAGIAVVFRAELFDMDANVVASNQISAPGTMIVIVPRRGISYSLVVISGDGSVPIDWSQPGMAASVIIRPIEEEAQPEVGVGITRTASTAVQQAGPMGVGLAFPFTFSTATGAPQVNSGIDHVVDGMQQVLLTRVMSRFIRREFGSPLAGKLFAPDTLIGQDIAASIQASLADFEHRAEVTNVIIRRNRVAGTVFADIKFRTFRTHREGNLVYPFNMETPA